MRNTLLLLGITLISVSLSAQDLDSLPDRNIFDLLNATGVYGNRVTLVLPNQLQSSIHSQILLNRTKKMQGFRIRIFSSNAQNARTTSQAVKEEFELLYPHIRAYPKYENIDHRVLVGNFRTRSEAMRFHKELTTRYQYRGAVIVREFIEFPSLYE